MREGAFAAFAAAMLVVTLAPRPPSHPAPSAPDRVEGLRLQVAWLAQRESAVGDWQAVKPPLREGDELQLSVLANEEACVYVLDDDRRLLFPSSGASPCLQPNWPYAVPGAHRTWRLDDAAHDVFFVVAARHPIADPSAALDSPGSTSMSAPDLLLPLRDGSRGMALTRTLRGDGILVDRYQAR